MSDRDVAEALSQLATEQSTWWQPPDVPQGFVGKYGHVEYRKVMAPEKRAVRAQILAASMCEVSRRHGAAQVFDHCHAHSWVRAVVCSSCNVKLGQLDAVRNLPGIAIVPGETGFGRIIMNCPGGVENMAAWIPASGPFAPKVEAVIPEKPKSWQNVLNLEFVVRPRALSTVHAAWGNRTACGLVADHALPATTQARYCGKCGRIVPPRHWEAFMRDGHARGLITAGVPS